ncbi:VOC family protein [Sphingobacterium hungaricum]|uniref:VOC domain-containing protein n=1 Tax=Sphingobacterium hungaricum TaxID=2082723 RepID=A0A928UXT0_9SPHI|nr:VOC family protein [Sphingobacterium hungaricum]MBE8714983.1 hypothetical protein [Sphingobacterium hungaricum]
MTPKINFITVAVEDMQESIEFYQQVFNFKIAEQSEDLCLFDMENGFYFVIQTKADFLQQRDNQNPAERSSGFILSCSLDSTEQVDMLVSRAEKMGAVQVKKLNEEWGYSVVIKDINGHHWEIVHLTQSN